MEVLTKILQQVGALGWDYRKRTEVLTKIIQQVGGLG